MKNIKLKNALLTSLSISSIVVGTSLIVVSNSSSILTNGKDSLLSSTSRTVSNNLSQKSNLINPDELFYTDPKLDSTLDVWNSSNNSENQENVKKWQAFKDNLDKVSGISSTKDELIIIANQALGVKKLKDAFKELDDLKNSNDIFTEAIINSIKNDLKTQTGFEENIADIPSINEINDKLLALSGIVEGTKIGSISNKTITINQLNKELSSSTTYNDTNDISTVAGTGYNQLIKIAEISPDEEGIYGISFKYKKTSSSATVTGNLIIRNVKESSSAGNDTLPLKQNLNSLNSLSTSTLDVFGRWDLGSNGTLGSGSYETKMENFIIQKGKDLQNNDVVEVLIRVKDGQTISDIQWSNDNLLPGVTSTLKQGKRLGILDVQANANNTFRSTILQNSLKSNGSTTSKVTQDDSNQSLYPSSGKLVENISSDINIIKEINFFSTTLTSKKITSTSKQDANSKANRKLEFYQYGNTSLSLPMYYAVGSESDISSNTFTYKPIVLYANGGVATTDIQQLSLNASDTTATTLSPSTYSMFSDLKDALPENVKSDFVNSSTIQLVSSFDSTKKLSHQTLNFYDNFYAIGTRDEGWTSVDVSGDVKLIKISDPTIKIFGENPNPTTTIDDNVSSNDTITSTLTAQETINERIAVIGFLGNVYEQFSKVNSGDFANEKYNFGYGQWVATGSNNSKIKYENKSFNGSAKQLYDELNKIWNSIVPIMKNLFNLSIDSGRYTISGSATAQSIVSSYIAFATEFTSNSSELENQITKAIEVVKVQFPNINETTTYESLSTETKQKLGTIMAKLIEIQIGTINNEFQLRLSTPIYDKLKSVLENENNKNDFSINSASSILSVATSQMKLIKYLPNQWDNVAKNGEVTLKSAVQSMLELLYFGNNEGTYLGNAIFTSGVLETLFNSFSSASLLNFDADSFEAKNNKLSVYNGIFLTFTNFDIQKIILNMLETGNASAINENQIISAFKESLLKISNKITRSESIQDSSVTSYYLDDLISGSNAIISLKWKRSQIATQYSRVTNLELLNAINNILNTNSQVSSSELSIWSNIILDTKDYSGYTSDFSGRNGDADLDKIANEIIKNETLLASRASDITPALIVLEFIIKYVWWVVLALIGLGVLVSSSVGVATRERQIKLASRPVIKWLLITSIVLGLAITGIAISFGLLVLL